MNGVAYFVSLVKLRYRFLYTNPIYISIINGQ